MSAPTRWDPFGDVTSLRDAMGQLFEQAFLRPGYNPGGYTPGGAWLGPMNVIETDGQYHCQIVVPGVRPEDLDLSVRQNTLTLTMAVKDAFPDETPKKATYLLKEFGPGEYSRSITFPKDVDGNKVEARYDRGLLYVTVPLAERAQPKRISITEAQGGQATGKFIEEKADTREPAQVN